MATSGSAFWLTQFGAPLVERELSLEGPGAGEALVEVLACGMCHTDLGYATGAVRPNHDLPLVLGHEVMGRVLQASSGFEHLLGLKVLVPAVLPCGDCDICAAGRGNACATQKMPGNDINGGFASHMVVPAAPLVSLAEAPEDMDLRALSVVSDAVSTAYQAVTRAELGEGDLALVVGVGGVGGFLAQIAAAKGAKVIAMDISDARLAEVKAYGAAHTINVAEGDDRAIRREVRGVAKEWGITSLSQRIFECSGTPAGQSLAYGLLARAATLVFVGFTMKKVEVRLSNLMAFDATALGTWGCPPERYPEVLRMIYEGSVVIYPFVEYAPLSEVAGLLEAMAANELSKRMILLPTG